MMCSVIIQNKKRGPPEGEQVLVSINKAEASWLSVFKRGSEWDRASVSNLERLGDANIFWGWRVSQTKTGNNEGKWSMEQTDWLRCHSVHTECTRTYVRQERETRTHTVGWHTSGWLGHNINTCIFAFSLFSVCPHIPHFKFLHIFCCVHK